MKQIRAFILGIVACSVFGFGGWQLGKWQERTKMEYLKYYLMEAQGEYEMAMAKGKSAEISILDPWGNKIVVVGEITSNGNKITWPLVKSFGPYSDDQGLYELGVYLRRSNRIAGDDRARSHEAK